MNLFENSIDKTKNWLPKDGTLNYYGKLFNQKQADAYLETLLNAIEWRSRYFWQENHNQTKSSLVWRQTI